MVYSRQKNAKADANPSKTVFSKEHNDLFIQKVQEYSLYAKGEILNLFVLGLNKYSTVEDIKKSYRSMSLQFHPDKNIHEDASKVMRMINQGKEGLEDTLRNNDAVREEERVRMAEETIILSSDDNSYSETSKISSEPATSSNKASTFTADHNSDNEETPLKKTHAGPWTSKKEVLETIKKLHLKCRNVIHISFKMVMFTPI